MITLTQLSYIVAIEKYGNFKKAAKACFVTQPTLSMQIQKMEEELGIIIFDRSKQPITTTIPGRQIVEQARVVLNEAERIEEMIREAKQSIEGDFRLGVIPTLAPYLIPRFSRQFIKNYPKVSLIIEESKTETIIDALKTNQLDAGLLVTPLKEDGILEYPIFEEPFYIYAAKEDDSIFEGKNLINQLDIPTDNLLLLNEGHCMREQMLNICHIRDKMQEKRRFNLWFESGSIETLINMVDNGLGFTIIPFLAISNLKPDQGKIIPFEKPIPTREISLVVHRSFIKKAILEAMQSTIKDSLPRELPSSSNQSTKIPIK